MSKEYKLNSINILDLLFIIFTYLKLTNQIDWSWWYVCTPVIISFIISFFGMLLSLAGKKTNNT